MAARNGPKSRQSSAHDIRGRCERSVTNATNAKTTTNPPTVATICRRFISERYPVWWPLSTLPSLLTAVRGNGVSSRIESTILPVVAKSRYHSKSLGRVLSVIALITTSSHRNTQQIPFCGADVANYDLIAHI